MDSESPVKGIEIRPVFDVHGQDVEGYRTLDFGRFSDQVQKPIADEIARLQQENADLQRSIEDLTPGGSEFVNSPKNCLRFIRDRMRTTGAIAKERNDLRRENADLHQLADHYRQLYLEVLSSSTNVQRALP